MSVAATSNTVSSHSDIIISLQLLPPIEQSSHAARPFRCGEIINGWLQLETKDADDLALGRIEVECIVREGSGLPLSNAVLNQQPEGLSGGYHPARKGTTSFPIQIPLPSSLPPSLQSPLASITYTLHANVEVAKHSDRQILHTSTIAHVVSRPVAEDQCPHGGRSVKDGSQVPVHLGGGRIAIQLTDGAQQATGTRRWSTPAELFSGYLPTLRPLPTPILSKQLPARPLSLQPDDHRPVYVQPKWVIHGLPAVLEDDTETKAARTSRHLRETSGHRGRSVSPPPLLPPLNTPPHRHRPPSVTGSRPILVRAVSAPKAMASASTLPAPHERIERTGTPPLLFPMPLLIEPSSYSDQVAYSPPSESPLNLGKLSPATTPPLENLAELLDLSPKTDTTRCGRTLSPVRPGPGRSPVKERKSVLDVFPPRPDVKRRESNERKVEIETRHQQEMSYAAEVIEEVLPATLTCDGSVRGRGGQVSAVKDLFEAPVHVIDRKARRKSVPPVTGSMLVNQAEVDNARRQALLEPNIARPRKVSPPSTARPGMLRTDTENTIEEVRQFVPPPPLYWEGPRAAKKRFEEVDAKDLKGAGRKGAVGRLKALIERFERR